MFPFSYVYLLVSIHLEEWYAHLYNQVEMSLVIIESGRGVRPDNVLSLNLGTYRDMLTDG